MQDDEQKKRIDESLAALEAETQAMAAPPIPEAAAPPLVVEARRRQWPWYVLQAVVFFGILGVGLYSDSRRSLGLAFVLAGAGYATVWVIKRAAAG